MFNSESLHWLGVFKCLILTTNAQWGRTRFFWISGLAKVKHRVLYTKVSAKLPHLTIWNKKLTNFLLWGTGLIWSKFSFCSWKNKPIQPCEIHIFFPFIFWGKIFSCEAQLNTCTCAWVCLSVCLSVCPFQNWISHCFPSLWLFMTAYDCLWQLMTVYDNLLQLMTAFDSFWQLMTAYDSLWQLMTAFDSFWQMTVSDSFCT